VLIAAAEAAGCLRSTPHFGRSARNFQESEKIFDLYGIRFDGPSRICGASLMWGWSSKDYPNAEGLS